MRNKSILQITKDTRKRFLEFREKYAEDKDCNDDTLVNDLLTFAEENAEEER